MSSVGQQKRFTLQCDHVPDYVADNFLK
jgi:hypothetical protein